MTEENFPHEKDLKTHQGDLKAKSVLKEKKKSDKVKRDQTSSDDAKSLATLQAQVKALQAKNDQWEDKYLRGEAERQNAQKRFAKERAQLIKYESQNLGRDVLPAVDNLERALAVENEEAASASLRKGVQMTLDLLKKALVDHDITEIKAEGQKFDPARHQAVQTVPATKEQSKDEVVQVLQKGYLYKDRTLRPAMVVVSQ